MPGSTGRKSCVENFTESLLSQSLGHHFTWVLVKSECRREGVMEWLRMEWGREERMKMLVFYSKAGTPSLVLGEARVSEESSDICKPSNKLTWDSVETQHFRSGRTFR